MHTRVLVDLSLGVEFDYIFVSAQRRRGEMEENMLSMVEYVHERMHTYDNLEIGVDFTMGNGHDTKSLIECCKEVYSFDIQEEALIHTRELVGDKAHLIRDSHENFDHYVDTFDIGIFNLGYLPEGDHNITTTLDITQRTLIKAVEHMKKVIFITCYIGHPQGKEEALWIDHYVSRLDTHTFNVSSFKMMNKKNAPYVIEIERK